MGGGGGACSPANPICLDPVSEAHVLVSGDRVCAVLGCTFAHMCGVCRGEQVGRVMQDRPGPCPTSPEPHLPLPSPLLTSSSPCALSTHTRSSASDHSWLPCNSVSSFSLLGLSLPTWLMGQSLSLPPLPLTESAYGRWNLMDCENSGCLSQPPWEERSQSPMSWFISPVLREAE